MTPHPATYHRICEACERPARYHASHNPNNALRIICAGCKTRGYHWSASGHLIDPKGMVVR